jgi:hypothetical protein
MARVLFPQRLGATGRSGHWSLLRQQCWGTRQRKNRGGRTPLGIWGDEPCEAEPLSTALLQLVLLTSSSCRRSPSSCQIPKKDSSLLCFRPQTLWIRPLFLQLHTTTPLLPSQADRATASPGVPPFSHFLGNISVLRVPTTTAPTSPLLHFFFHLHPSIPSVGHPLTSLPIPPIISTPAIK